MTFIVNFRPISILTKNHTCFGYKSNYFKRKHSIFGTNTDTGKFVSEALILESVNPQYDERLFTALQEK